MFNKTFRVQESVIEAKIVTSKDTCSVFSLDFGDENVKIIYHLFTGPHVRLVDSCLLC